MYIIELTNKIFQTFSLYLKESLKQFFGHITLLVRKTTLNRGEQEEEKT